MCQISGLVVDDNMDIAFLTAQTFKDNHIAVHTLNHGDVAFRWLEENVPNIVLLDLQLPGASGLELLKYIRQWERFQSTIVIILTANPNMAQVAEECGADFTLQKPTSFRDLSTLISRLVAKLQD